MESFVLILEHGERDNISLDDFSGSDVYIASAYLHLLVDLSGRLGRRWGRLGVEAHPLPDTPQESPAARVPTPARVGIHPQSEILVRGTDFFAETAFTRGSRAPGAMLLIFVRAF